MNSDNAAYVRDEDREFFARELDSFVPARVFDAHCHIWRGDAVQTVKGLFPPSTDFAPDVGYEEYMRLIDALHPSRRVSALFIPGGRCTRENMLSCNQWVAEQVVKDDTCRGSFYVTPQDDPEWVRQEVRRLGLHGLKCYHTWVERKPTWEADIPDYLPEEIVRVAHEEGWAITLHMVKSRAVADPSNIHWIRTYCEKYPNMKLILAHSARGFQPSHNLEGLPQLLGLDNLYFDSSSNCEPMAHATIIRIHGHKKLLYASDFYVSHCRGRSLGAADSFLWLYEDTPVWQEKQATIKPVLIGLEHLRSLKWACWSTGLTDNQVEDIFWNNAAELFGISASTSLSVARVDRQETQ